MTVPLPSLDRKSMNELYRAEKVWTEGKSRKHVSKKHEATLRSRRFHRMACLTSDSQGRTFTSDCVLPVGAENQRRSCCKPHHVTGNTKSNSRVWRKEGVNGRHHSLLENEEKKKDISFTKQRLHSPNKQPCAQIFNEQTVSGPWHVDAQRFP
jgi:hypothetical protein